MHRGLGIELVGLAAIRPFQLGPSPFANANLIAAAKTLLHFIVVQMQIVVPHDMHTQHPSLPRIDAVEAIWPALLMWILAETTIYKARSSYTAALSRIGKAGRPTTDAWRRR
jgi:hypothetical protein